MRKTMLVLGILAMLAAPLAAAQLDYHKYTPIVENGTVQDAVGLKVALMPTAEENETQTEQNTPYSETYPELGLNVSIDKPEPTNETEQRQVSPRVQERFGPLMDIAGATHVDYNKVLYPSLNPSFTMSEDRQETVSSIVFGNPMPPFPTEERVGYAREVAKSFGVQA